MNAKELLKAGRLTEARGVLTEAVRSSPADLSRRTLLFQVLCYLGEWDKAERHLDIMAAQDTSRETGVQVYKNLIHAERERLEVVKSRQRPSFLPKSPPYAELYFAACEKLTLKRFEEAADLYAQVEEQRPEISGILNGEDFSGIKDTDAFLSLFLETIIYEHYFWIPFESIAELNVSSPKTLLDLLWITAHITTFEGLTANCYLPVLYPDSFSHEDDRIKLGRMTDWAALGGPFLKGLGRHVFQIGKTDMSILDIREATFHFPVSLEPDEETT